MCVILSYEIGADVFTESDLYMLSWSNPDGFAVVFDDGKLRRIRTLCEHRAIAEFLQLQDNGIRCAIHMRMTSIGENSIGNCHGFPLHDGYLMHNGHMSGFGNSRYSDSREFAKTLRNLDRKACRKIIENIDDSQRFLLFSRTTEYYGAGWIRSNNLVITRSANSVCRFDSPVSFNFGFNVAKGSKK